MDKAVDRLNKKLTDYIVETGIALPPILTVSREDYAELLLTHEIDFIPDGYGYLTIPTYRGAKIELECK